jgi:hypothetical protein
VQLSLARYAMKTTIMDCLLNQTLELRHAEMIGSKVPPLIPSANRRAYSCALTLCYGIISPNTGRCLCASVGQQ